MFPTKQPNDTFIRFDTLRITAKHKDFYDSDLFYTATFLQYEAATPPQPYENMSFLNFINI